jgi:hypothetical protein
MVLSSKNVNGGVKLKIDNTPTAIVASVGIMAAAGLAAFLVSAGWSAEAIIGFAVLALGLITGQAVNARKTATIEAKTDQQTGTLETIARQTDGELKQAISDAVADGIDRASRVAVDRAYDRGRGDQAGGL